MEIVVEIDRRIDEAAGLLLFLKLSVAYICQAGIRPKKGMDSGFL